MQKASQSVGGKKHVDIVAYYLPQFYPLPINNAHWGEGFTEWNSVVACQRGWRSRRSSRLTPGELGFYDLRSPEIRRRQGALARDSGLAAFAVYHYWSRGDRVMPEVVDAMLKDGEPDFPFFFCWANHDWTLAWQGRPDVKTWAQEYDEHKSDSHIEWLCEGFKDRRYYTIGGAPVLAIFDPLSVPFLKQVAERWRKFAKNNGFPGLVILGVARELTPGHPEELGLDGWIQSPGVAVGAVPKWRRALASATTISGLARLVAYRDYNYSATRVGRVMRESRALCHSRLTPTVISTWNNAGRRKTGAWSMETSVLEFERQLREAVRDAPQLPHGAPSGKRIVVVNAWNEWGEAMAIEPSVEHGRGFLEAVRRVVQSEAPNRL